MLTPGQLGEPTTMIYTTTHISDQSVSALARAGIGDKARRVGLRGKLANWLAVDE